MQTSSCFISKKSRRKIIFNSIELLNKRNSEKKFTFNEECAICFSKIGDNSIILKCKHVFCYSCLEKWKETYNNSFCPMCKKSIEDEDKVLTLDKYEYTNFIDLFISRKYYEN